MISSSADKTIRLWNGVAGECIAILQQHQNWVWSLTQNPHNGILLSSGQNETINVWNLAAGTSLKILRCPRPYEGTVMTGTTGLTEAQKITLQALGTTEARVH